MPILRRARAKGADAVDVRSDLPQGTLDLLILKVLAPEPLHGYAIAQRLQQVSRDVVQVQQGTLYPALHRLEQRGYLSAAWKASDTGRDAKFYTLTKQGQAQLESGTASWDRLATAIGLILRPEGGRP
jgi:PadR family transcriptional regulator, regulatory protein PadR